MFSNNSHAPQNAYSSVGVESLVPFASPHRLVTMLFDGARAAIALAKGHMQRKEIAAKCAAISKATDIIDGGLKASLDLNVGGELAQNLYDLYEYMTLRLVHANQNNDAKALDEVATLLEQLGGAWKAIGDKAADGGAPAGTAPSVPATGATTAKANAAPPAAAPPTPKQAAKAAEAATAKGTANIPAPATPASPAKPPAAQMQQRRVAAAYGVR
jgi:flagellar protein FliS